VKPYLFCLAIAGTACVAPPNDERVSELATPRIRSITPARPAAGDVVTIRGSDFGADRGTSWVRVAAQPFNDRPTILSWSDTEIVARLDAQLQGTGTLSVMVGRVPSNTIALPLQIPCAPIPELTRSYDLPRATESEAFDVATATHCRVAVVGRARVEARDQAFLLVTDEFGKPLPTYPRYFEGIAEWRTVVPVDDGFVLAGTTTKGESVVTQLDAQGLDVAGWPRRGPEGGTDRVYGAIRTPHQVVVVGTRGPAGFVTRYGLDGSLLADAPLTTELLGTRRALGVRDTPGGFVVVGDRTYVDAAGTKHTDGAVTQFSVYGEVTDERWRTSPDTLRAAALVDHDTRLLAVGDFGSGAIASFQYPAGSAEPAFLAPPTTTLADVQPLDRGFVAAGSGRGDGILVYGTCAGQPTASRTIDLGHDETLAAVATLYDSAFTTVERGYLAAGATRIAGRPRALLARRDAFPVTQPVVTLAVAGGPDAAADLGSTIPLTFSVADAVHFELRKVAGPGPALDLAGDPGGSPISNTISLGFDTAALRACAARGCGATTYELVATAASVGRCPQGRQTRATVSVFFELAPRWLQLVQSASLVTEKYGSVSPLVVAAHVDYTHGFPHNRCLTNLGLPYGTPDARHHAEAPAPGEAVTVDDRAPGLVTYDADATGLPTRLASYGLGTWFLAARPTIEGYDWVEPEQWEGHWGGWHTGEGGMTIAVPGEPAAVDWHAPSLVPPQDCGSRGPGCGATWPVIPHPALWDVHVFLPSDGSLPRVEFTADQAGLPDPCAELSPASPAPPLAGCDTGVPSLGLSPFFVVDASGSAIPQACSGS